MKKTIILALVFSLMLSFCPMIGSAAYTSDTLNDLQAGEVTSLGALISDIQLLGCYTDVKEDGSVIFYGVTSGPPALFFAYDLNERKIVDKHELQTKDGIMAKVSYGVDMGADGILNITTQSHSLFFRYNTNTKEMKCYGKIFEETAVMTTGYVDSEDNYYFGTYPNAKLIKYDKKADKLVDLGTMIPTGDYVRALCGYQDTLYMGGIGNPTTEWVKYDIKTGNRTVLKNPSKEGLFTESDVENFYSASVAGKYLFARCKIASLNQYYMCVFDMEREEWIDFIPGVMHLHCTDFENGYVYFVKNLGSSKGRCLVGYNPETKETIETSAPSINPASYVVAPKFVTLKDQENYPGRTFVAGSNTHGILLVNPEGKKSELIKEGLPQNYTTVRTLKGGIDGELVISAYMGTKFVVYDTENKKIKYEGECTQIERIEVIDNKYYFGLYGTNAGIREFDPVTRNAPVLLGQMTGLEQNRAFNITDAGDNIVWGSFPDYGKLGGAVAIYNKKTKQTRAYKEPVKNQCIAGLVCKDGKIYGSTSVYGGLGIDAIDAPAQLFIMDIETGEVEKSKEVVLTTTSDRQYFVGDLIFDKNGNLWAGTAKTLLKINPETLDIIKEIPIGTGKDSLTVTRGIPFAMEIGPDGLLYTNIGRKVSAVDLETCEVKTLASVNTGAMTLCDDGNIYMINNKTAINLDKIELGRNRPDNLPVIATSVKFEGEGSENPILVKTHAGHFERFSDNYAVVLSKLGTVDSSLYTLYEYGVLGSSTVNEPTIGERDFKAKAQLSLTKDNSYGVLLYNLTDSKSYYLRPYAVYADNNGYKWTVYGDTLVRQGQ